jgi:phosphatidylglycerol:prolipoprotein diacylglycerol transferase
MFDVVAAGVPVGIGLVRLANFINSELWGRPTDVPWAIVFPNGGPEPRHPSQLYEAAAGRPRAVCLVLRILAPTSSLKLKRRASSPAPSSPATACRASSSSSSASPTPSSAISLGGWLTMGMVLSLPMVLFGLHLAMMRAPAAAKTAE